MSIAISSYDVLSGRDKQAFGHEGNNFFRDVVQLHREAYQTARRRADKNSITKAVIRRVHDQGGRFLKINDETGIWELLCDDLVYEKVSHALRGAKSPSSKSKSQAKKKIGATTIKRPAPSPIVASSFEAVMARQKAIFDMLISEQNEPVHLVSDSSSCGDESSDDEALHSSSSFDDMAGDYTLSSVELSIDLDTTEFELISSESLFVEV